MLETEGAMVEDIEDVSCSVGGAALVGDVGVGVCELVFLALCSLTVWCSGVGVI